jgi:phospholipid-binding lipoprotein MlaA
MVRVSMRSGLRRLNRRVKGGVWMGRVVLATLAAALVIAPGWNGGAWAEVEEPYDPIEPFNRGIFWFNERVDLNVLQPIAEVYDSNVPDPVQKGIGNFFLNLRYPSYLVSDLIQGKLTQALDHTGRFIINSTIGVVGLIDFAKDMGLPDHEEDFAIALASHGVPAGPYLVLPFLGPSNVRDGVGRIVDGFLDPIGWVGYSSLSRGTKLAISTSALAVRIVHTRAGLLQAIDAARESSVDLYLFMQGAYYQHRHGLVTDGADEESPGDEEQSGGV